MINKQDSHYMIVLMLDPVSYTHLKSFAETILPPPCSKSRLYSATYSKEKSVSYTHLDVYKRQVPDSSFTLEAGDECHISIDGIGTLVNKVKWI